MLEASTFDVGSVIAGIIFSLMFFILGLVYKIVSDYRKDTKERLQRLNELLFAHAHNEDGTCYIPRK